MPDSSVDESDWPGRRLSKAARSASVLLAELFFAVSLFSSDDDLDSEEDFLSDEDFCEDADSLPDDDFDEDAVLRSEESLPLCSDFLVVVDLRDESSLSDVLARDDVFFWLLAEYSFSVVLGLDGFSEEADFAEADSARDAVFLSRPKLFPELASSDFDVDSELGFSDTSALELLRSALVSLE